jgi:hypothetical protein
LAASRGSRAPIVDALPTFCRHNRLVQNCPICAREQNVALRPVVSPGGHTPPVGRPGTGRERGTRAREQSAGRGGSQRAGVRGQGGLVVRKLSRGVDDGFHSRLTPGLRSSADAERLAEELAFAAARLSTLASGDPPGLYAEVADVAQSIEQRTWLAFQIACICPLDGEAPFAAIDAARTSWESGQAPALEGIELGPRSADEAGLGTRTFDAYRAWAERAGSQAAAFTGEAAWTPERRFARVFERLSLPGLHRGARFDLLVTLGRLGVGDLRAGSLALGGNDPVTLAAKRLLGIGDPLLLERRAAELASACELPLESLDVGFFNWERGSRASLGMPDGAEPDPAVLDRALSALGLD